MDYGALRAAAASLGKEGVELPAEAPTEESLAAAQTEEGNPLLRAIHSALLELDVIEGRLECPETGHHFPISNGIPNMLVPEDQVA